MPDPCSSLPPNKVGHRLRLPAKPQSVCVCVCVCVLRAVGGRASPRLQQRAYRATLCLCRLPQCADCMKQKRITPVVPSRDILRDPRLIAALRDPDVCVCVRERERERARERARERERERERESRLAARGEARPPTHCPHHPIAQTHKVGRAE